MYLSFPVLNIFCSQCRPETVGVSGQSLAEEISNLAARRGDSGGGHGYRRTAAGRNPWSFGQQNPDYSRPQTQHYHWLRQVGSSKLKYVIPSPD